MTNVISLPQLDELIAAVKQAQLSKEYQTTVMTTEGVLNRIQISRPTLYRLIAKGLFPAPFKIGLRKNGWLVADIECWLSERKETASSHCHYSVQETRLKEAA